MNFYYLSDYPTQTIFKCIKIRLGAETMKKKPNCIMITILHLHVLNCICTISNTVNTITTTTTTITTATATTTTTSKTTNTNTLLIPLL